MFTEGDLWAGNRHLRDTVHHSIHMDADRSSDRAVSTGIGLIRSDFRRILIDLPWHTDFVGSSNKTGGGVGTNQYQVRGQAAHHLVAPTMAVVAPSISTPIWTADQIAAAKTILAQGVRSDKKALVSRPDLPQEVLMAVLRPEQEPGVRYDLRMKALRHPNLASETIRKIWRDPENNNYRAQNTAAIIVHHPNTPPDVLNEIGWQARLQLGPNPSEETSQKTLQTATTRLGHDPDMNFADATSLPQPDLRAAAARSPDCPAPILTQLARDPNPWVRSAVAVNPHSDSDLLNELATDEDHYVKQTLVRRQDLPAPAVERLATDAEDSEIRAGAACHPKVSPATLAVLAEDDSVAVRIAVANNLRTPDVALVPLITDDNFQVRANALRHPNLPDHIRAISALGR